MSMTLSAFLTFLPIALTAINTVLKLDPASAAGKILATVLQISQLFASRLPTATATAPNAPVPGAGVTTSHAVAIPPAHTHVQAIVNSLNDGSLTPEKLVEMAQSFPAAK